MPIPSETLGLREAAERFGVSVDTLRRRIKDDAMPEAFKAEGKFGTTWVVPIAAMADIADRERWVLKLDIEPDLVDNAVAALADLGSGAVTTVGPGGNAAPTGLAQTSVGQNAAAQTLTSAVPTALPTPDTPVPNGRSVAMEIRSKPLISEENLEWVERLLAAETRATGAETRLESMAGDAAAAERRIAQLSGDLEHERAELRRLRTDLASEERAQAVAVARTDELRGQLKSDRLDLEARIGFAQSDAQTHQERAEDLHARLADTQAAMGWWSRRRLNKLAPNAFGAPDSPPVPNRLR